MSDEKKESLYMRFKKGVSDIGKEIDTKTLPVKRYLKEDIGSEQIAEDIRKTGIRAESIGRQAYDKGSKIYTDLQKSREENRLKRIENLKLETQEQELKARLQNIPRQSQIRQIQLEKQLENRPRPPNPLDSSRGSELLYGSQPVNPPSPLGRGGEAPTLFGKKGKPPTL